MAEKKKTVAKSTKPKAKPKAKAKANKPKAKAKPKAKTAPKKVTPKKVTPKKVTPKKVAKKVMPDVVKEILLEHKKNKTTIGEFLVTKTRWERFVAWFKKRFK